MSTPTPTRPRRRPVRVLLGAVAVLPPILLFALLTGLVIDGGAGWDPVDRSVSIHAYEFVAGHDRLISVLELFGHVTEPTVLRVLMTITAIVLWRRGRHRVALWLGGTVWIGGILAIIAKQVVQRTRPEFADPVASAVGYAFPSGHAAGSFLFAGCAVVLVALRRPRPGPDGATVEAPASRLVPAVLAAVAFVLLVATDRLLLNVHYVSDIIGGWTLSSVVLLVSLAVATPWRERDPRHP